MSFRSIAALDALTAMVRLYPKMSAAAAFEFGIMAGSAFKAARRRGSLKAVPAAVIEAMPLAARALAPRKTRRKPARRAGTGKAAKPVARRPAARNPKPAEPAAA